MTQGSSNTPITKQLTLKSIMGIFCSALFLILTFFLAPLLAYLNSDILLYSTPLPLVVDIIIKLLENAVFAVCYTLIIYSAVLYSIKNTVWLAIIYAFAALIRKAATIGLDFISGSTPDFSDYFSLGFTYLAELIQVTAIITVAVIVGNSYKAISKKRNKAATRLGDLSLYEKLDFSPLFSKKNPIHICAVFAGALISFVNISQRISYDVFYGMPSDLSDILTMIAYYISDVLLGLLVYAGIWFFSAKLYKRDSSNEA